MDLHQIYQLNNLNRLNYQCLRRNNGIRGNKDHQLELWICVITYALRGPKVFDIPAVDLGSQVLDLDNFMA